MFRCAGDVGFEHFEGDVPLECDLAGFVDHARAAFEAGTQPGIPNGRILRGDGGGDFTAFGVAPTGERAESAVLIFSVTSRVLVSITYTAASRARALNALRRASCLTFFGSDCS